MDPIDLDQNATSPLDPKVLEAMRPHLLSGGNPGSRHALGRAARRALESSRETVARVLDAEPSEVVFTGGGTEANNLALFGLFHRDGLQAAGHLVCSPLEHPAVAGPVEALEATGAEVTRPPVGSDGRMTARVMADAIRPDTRFAALLLAHNETGALQPVAELAELAKPQGVPIHTDASQAIGRVPVSFRGLGVATLAAGAHKMHGPAGVGVLLIRKGLQLAPWLIGGGQESGRRPGTPAVALAVGMAVALDRWHLAADARIIRWRALRDRLEARITAALPPGRVVRLGPLADPDRLPQTLHLGFPGLDGDALLMGLDLAGVACSLGSACASGSTTPSPSMQAMNLPPELLRASVRLSFGAFTTEADIDEAARRIVAVIGRLAEPDAA